MPEEAGVGILSSVVEGPLARQAGAGDQPPSTLASRTVVHSAPPSPQRPCPTQGTHNPFPTSPRTAGLTAACDSASSCIVGCEMAPGSGKHSRVQDQMSNLVLHLTSYVTVGRCLTPQSLGFPICITDGSNAIFLCTGKEAKGAE
jgi:hypothetical protein